MRSPIQQEAEPLEFEGLVTAGQVCRLVAQPHGLFRGYKLEVSEGRDCRLHDIKVEAQSQLRLSLPCRDIVGVITLATCSPDWPIELHLSSLTTCQFKAKLYGHEPADV